DKPSCDGWLTWMWQEAGIGGNRTSLNICWFDKIVWWVVIVMRNVFHYIMPDGSGACNTYHIVHRAVITISGPDTYSEIWCIPKSPVIFKTIGRASFCSSRAIKL